MDLNKSKEEAIGRYRKIQSSVVLITTFLINLMVALYMTLIPISIIQFIVGFSGMAIFQITAVYLVNKITPYWPKHLIMLDKLFKGNKH